MSTLRHRVTFITILALILGGSAAQGYWISGGISFLGLALNIYLFYKDTQGEDGCDY